MHAYCTKSITTSSAPDRQKWWENMIIYLLFLIAISNSYNPTFITANITTPIATGDNQPTSAQRQLHWSINQSTTNKPTYTDRPLALTDIVPTPPCSHMPAEPRPAASAYSFEDCARPSAAGRDPGWQTRGWRWWAASGDEDGRQCRHGPWCRPP